MPLRSQQITDETGRNLRTQYFPFHLDKRTPTPVNGFVIQNKSSSTNQRAKTPNTRAIANLPSSYMIVDYHLNKQKIMDQIDRTIDKTIEKPEMSMSFSSTSRPGTVSSSIVESVPSSPTNRSSRREMMHGAQPLRSSFLLKQKLPGEEIDLSKLLYNRTDQSMQTDRNLNKMEMKVTEYQDWSNNVVEPYLKELRKAIKANKPENLEDYITAYCEATRANCPIPDTQTPPPSQRYQHK